MSVQYQPLDEALEPSGPLQIIAEWEWGEKQVLQIILAKGVLEPNWDFVPVGNRLRFDLTFLLERSTKWGLISWDPAQVKTFWYRKPLLDLQPIFLLMSRGPFTGSSVHSFREEERGTLVPNWYRQGRFADIVEYVTKEHAAGMAMLRDARKILGDLGDARRKP